MCSKPVTSSLCKSLMSHVDVCLPPHGLHVLASCTHCKIALAETNIRLHRHTPTVYQTIAAAFHITHRSRAVPLKHQPAHHSPDTTQLLCPLLSRAQASLQHLVRPTGGPLTSHQQLVHNHRHGRQRHKQMPHSLNRALHNPSEGLNSSLTSLPALP